MLRGLACAGLARVAAQELPHWRELGAPEFHPQALMALLTLPPVLAATFYSKLDAPGRDRLRGLWAWESAPFQGESPRIRRLFARGCGPGRPGTGLPPTTTWPWLPKKPSAPGPRGGPFTT